MNIPAKHILSITDARRQLFSLTDAVYGKNSTFVLTERGKPKAVLMPVEEFESWQETAEILSDPTVLQELKQSTAEFAAGDHVTLEELLGKRKISSSTIQKRR